MKGEIRSLCAGRTVRLAPGEGRGAAPATAMPHISEREQLDGSGVVRFAQVTDEEYAGK